MAGYPRIILDEDSFYYIKNDLKEMKTIKDGKYFLVIPFEINQNYTEPLMQHAHFRPQTPTQEDGSVKQMEAFLKAFVNAEDMWLDNTHWDSIGIKKDEDGTVYFPNAYKLAFLQVARDILNERRKIKNKD